MNLTVVFAILIYNEICLRGVGLFVWGFFIYMWTEWKFLAVSRVEICTLNS